MAVIVALLFMGHTDL